MSHTARWQDEGDADASRSSPHVHAHANDGILLQYANNRYESVPLTRDRASRSVVLGTPAPMTMLPVTEIQRCSTFLRSLRDCSGCVGGLVLYLNCNSGRWLSAVPRQLCAPLSFRASLREIPRTQLPAKGHWRLAGSVRSIGAGFDEQTMLADTPGFDGVHVWLDLRYLLLPRAVLRMAGDQAFEVDPNYLFYDGPPGFGTAALQHVWCKSEGDV